MLAEDSRGLPVPEIVSGIAETLALKGYRMLLYDLHLLEKLYNCYEQIGTEAAAQIIKQIEDPSLPNLYKVIP